MWPRGRPIVRVFAAAHPPTSFNPTGSPARFRPVRETDGAVVPTMYGGADADVALAESVMHDLGASTTRIPYRRLVDRAICTLLPLRDLRLAALHGYGLRKAKVTRKRLIDTPPSRYPETAAWGQAVYDHEERVDGIVWMSRRFDSSKAVTLWSTRVRDRRAERGRGNVHAPRGRGRLRARRRGGAARGLHHRPAVTAV